MNMYIESLRMNFLRAALMICLPMLPMQVIAADEGTVPRKSSSTKKKKKKKKKPAADELSKTQEDTSATIDGTKPASHAKKWEALFNVGLDPNPMLGIGGTVARMISPTMAIEGYASRASGKIDPVAITVMSFGARVRKSVFKIPYVAGGLGMRMATGSWYTYNANQTDELPSTSTANAIVLNLAAGGQMRLGSFVLGADVVGINFPIAKMGVKDTPPTEEYDQTDFDEQKAKFNTVGGGMTMTLFKLGIGLAF